MAEEFHTLQELLNLIVGKYSDQVAFQARAGEGYRKITYRQIREIGSKIQAALAAMGVSQGDRVALLSENRPEWPISHYAITGMGAIAVPLDAMLRKEDIVPLLEDSEAKVIIASKNFIEFTKGTRVENNVLLMDDFEKLNPAAGRIDVKILPEDLAAILYTSGTTGVPKGVMLTHRNLTSNVASTIQFFPVGPGDNFLSVLPLHHTFESTVGMLCLTCLGAKITYAESLKSHNILQNMQETGVTHMLGVPLLYQLFYAGIQREVEEKKLRKVFGILFAISRFFKHVLGINVGRALFSTVHKKFGGKIKFMAVGGAPMDKDVLLNFDLMGFPIYQGYGLTETSPILTLNHPKKGNIPASNRYGSVGTALPGVKLKVVGNESIGEILAYGPNVMKGYYKRQDLTDEVIDKDGWFHTGDLGYMDKDGFLFITGRAKDVIVTGSGVNVYPEEIEFMMKKIPAIKEAAILGSKIKEGIRKGMEEVLAVVVPNENVSDEAVNQAIKELNQKLADFKRIARVIIRKEELPKTRLLKIKKFLVRKEYGLL